MRDLAQFERQVIRGLLQGYDTKAIVTNLTIGSFELVPMRQIFLAMNSYFNRFNEVPQLDVLVNEIQKMPIKPEEISNIVAFLEKKDEITEDKFRYAYEEVTRAHKSRRLKVSMKKAIAHIDADNPDKAQDILLKDLTDVAAGGRDVVVVDYYENFVDRMTTVQKRQKNPELDKKFCISTGIEKLDTELDGGLRNGELGLMMAPPEGGKSISLQDITISAILAGYKVCFVTIEMTPEQTAYRFDSRLAQIKYRKFRRAQMSEDDYEKWDAEVSKLKPNALKILGVPEGCSCRLIGAELSKLSGVFQPDMVVVDYVGIMSPNEGGYQSAMDWKYIGEIVKNLKGLALKLNIPIWSAAQLLVGAKEKVELSFGDIGLARQQIAAHADIAIGIIQTSQMRTMDLTKLQFIKIREGCENRFLEINSDYDRISLVRRSIDGI